MPRQAVAEFLQQLDKVVAEGQLPTAERMLDELLAEFPNHDELLYRKFRLLLAQRKLDAAFLTSLSFSAQLKSNPAVNFEILMTLPQLQNLPINPAVEAELCRILTIKNLDCQPIWRIIHGIFKHRLTKSKATDNFLVSLSENQLFNTILRNFVLWDAGLETECTAIRKKLLELFQADTDRAKVCSPLILSMAKHCFENEHVYYLTVTERETVAQLRSAFAAASAGEQPFDEKARLTLLVLLMYFAPAELLGDSELSTADLDALDPEFAEFLNNCLAECRLIRQYTTEFIKQSHIADDAIAKVARLYDTNPYPRWTKGPLNVNVQAKEYPDLLGLNRCPGWRNIKLDRYKTMLVAGCGTGRHPSFNAVMFPWLEITAVDISASCLAYARMMAERLNITTMRFSVADIMAMDTWDQQFDIIECLGVLHHLENPEAGLKNLVDLLVPGGIIKLGYYSEAARANITRLRQERPPQGQQSDRDYIRELRHRLVTDPEYREYTDILELGDFYTSSGASNVLLHEQEAQYTLPRLQQVLDDHGLQFLSVIEEDKPRFAAAGGQGSPHELMNWHPLEQQNPKFFAGMYEFYCQKKS